MSFKQYVDPVVTMDALTVADIFMEVLLAVLAILGNITVLLAIRFDRQLHTVTNVLLASLALSDLLVGVVIGLELITLTGEPRNFYGCLFVNCLVITLTGVSALNLLIVAIERYIAIKFPFWYLAHFSIGTAFVLAISGWVVGVALGLTPMYGWNNKDDAEWNTERDNGTNQLPPACSYLSVVDVKQHVYFQFFGVVCVPLVLMLAIYISLFVEVRRTSRKIASLEVAKVKPKSASQAVYRQSEVRAARKFALVIGSFVICWFPLELQNCAYVWYQRHCVPCAVVSVWLSHLNAGLNPFLYANANGRLRRAMRRVFLCYRRVQRTSVTTWSGGVSTAAESSIT